MKIFIMIFAIGILCSSCGVKENPEYKAQFNQEKAIRLI